MSSHIGKQIQQVYIGLLGRAADKEGLDYWKGQIADGSMTLESLRANIVNEQQEYKDGLGSMTRAQVVNELYNRMFDRNAKSEGLEYWVNGGGKEVPVDRLVLALMNGASAADKLALDNKADAGNYYTTELGANYTKSSAQKAVENVNGDSKTLTDAKKLVDQFKKNPTKGSDFTLTDKDDTITGTAQDDTIKATLATFNASDSIDGGDGDDTIAFNVNSTSAAAVINLGNASEFTSVEKVSVRDAGGSGGSGVTINLSSVSGVKEVILERTSSAVTVQELGAGTLSINGNGVSTNGNVTFTNSRKVTGDMTINLRGVNGGDIDLNGGSNNNGQQAKVTINALSKSKIGAVELSNDLTTSLTINATGQLNTGAITGFKDKATVTITGAGKVVFGTNFVAEVDKVDASGNSGGITAGAESSNGNLNFIGSSAADVFTLGKTYSKDDKASIDGGDGTDHLLVTGNQITKDNAAKFKNWEVLHVKNTTAVTLDASLVKSFTALTLEGTEAITLNKLSADLGKAVTLKDGATGKAITLNIVNATNNGTKDEVTIKEVAKAAKTTELRIAGVETINFETTKGLTLEKTDGMAAWDQLNISGKGAFSINLTDGSSGSVTIQRNATVDAEKLEAAFTINASDTSGSGLVIKGSATKANTITGTGQTDNITGGTDVDKVTFSAGMDTVDFKDDEKNDEFIIADAETSGRTTISNFDAGGSGKDAKDKIKVTDTDYNTAVNVVKKAGNKLGSAAIDNDVTVFEQSAGGTGALVTGGTRKIDKGKWTSMSDVAAYLNEAATGASGADAVFVLNNGTDTYVYTYNEGGVSASTIDAADLKLIAHVKGAVLDATDFGTS